MSAHSVGEFNIADRSYVGVLSTTEQRENAREYHRQAAFCQNTHHLQPDAADTFSSRWVKSASRSCFDRLIAGISLLALLPVMLLIMVLVRVSSSGPVFFRQRRAGRHQKEFTLYKFRSMRVEDPPGPPITVSGDPRITALGAFLRRYKLDELPQFWNVLIGDMSLVGPRPKLPHHEGLDLYYRPGITGIASLAFRNEEKILSGIPQHQLDAFYDDYIKPRKAQLDSEYMQSASLWSDLAVLWLTALSCLFGLDNLPARRMNTSLNLPVRHLLSPAISPDLLPGHLDPDKEGRSRYFAADWPPVVISRRNGAAA